MQYQVLPVAHHQIGEETYNSGALAVEDIVAWAASQTPLQRLFTLICAAHCATLTVGQKALSSNLSRKLHLQIPSLLVLYLLPLPATIEQFLNAMRTNPVVKPNTYDFSSCFFPKFKVMHFQNGDIKLYTVVLLFLCFLKILTKLCCRWSRNRRSTVNNCRVREFQIPYRRAQ